MYIIMNNVLQDGQLAADVIAKLSSSRSRSRVGPAARVDSMDSVKRQYHDILLRSCVPCLPSLNEKEFMPGQ